MLHFWKKVISLAMAMTLAAAILTAALAASVGVTVNTSTRFYRSASTSSASVAIARGTSLTMTAVSGNWARVTYRGVTGYMPVQYLNSKTRYGAYVNRNTYVYAGASTSSARRAVAVNTAVYVIGKSGGFYRIQNASGSVTCYIPAGYLSHSKVSVAAPKVTKVNWRAKVVKVDWFKGGSGILAKGAYGYLYDIATGTVIKIKRMGGSNHADVEPATKTDTAKLYRMVGGSYSWDSRPVILYAGGRFVACAINTMPHGSQTITSNGYNGQFCLHMVNSRTHDSNSVNESHQAAINYAYNWAH